MSNGTVIRVNSTGMGGGEGSQHSQSVEATFMHIPGLKIAIPATPADALGLFRAAVRDDNPVLFFEHRQLKRSKKTDELPLDPDFVVPLGEAQIRRRGGHVTIVTYAYLLEKCLAAADQLAGQGIEAEVIDLRSLSPWDKQTVLNSVGRTGRLIDRSSEAARPSFMNPRPPASRNPISPKAAAACMACFRALAW